MEEYLEAKREREKTGFDIKTSIWFWILKQADARDTDQIATENRG
jgi:hypothetical protein